MNFHCTHHSQFTLVRNLICIRKPHHYDQRSTRALSSFYRERSALCMRSTKWNRIGEPINELIALRRSDSAKRITLSSFFIARYTTYWATRSSNFYFNVWHIHSFEKWQIECYYRGMSIGSLSLPRLRVLISHRCSYRSSETTIRHNQKRRMSRSEIPERSNTQI